MQRNTPDDIIYGVQPVREALVSGRRIKKIFMSREKMSEGIQVIMGKAAAQNIPVVTCSREEIEKLCRTSFHQGIIALTDPYRYSTLKDIISVWKKCGDDGAFVLLDGIEDPTNLGSLIRTSAACGVHGIIIPKDRSAKVTPAVIKISAGAAECVSVAQVTNLSQAMQQLKDEGFWIYGADPEGGETLHSLSFARHVGCVIGGEGHGLRELIKKQCDVLFRIDTPRAIPLNAAVAGSMVLYEVMRQRLIKKHSINITN